MTDEASGRGRVDGALAVLADSDLMAAGALRVFREFGRVVPDEVAVLGFDNAQLPPHLPGDVDRGSAGREDGRDGRPPHGATRRS